jgi:hypothetical protein
MISNISQDDQYLFADESTINSNGKYIILPYHVLKNNCCPIHFAIESNDRLQRIIFYLTNYFKTFYFAL